MVNNYFTRANDFGYSKHPDETLKIWDEEKVLSDVVWAIRTFKPDVIINRFDHRTPGTTHGHHTSSAMLSVEAFDLVNDPSKFSNQLKLYRNMASLSGCFLIHRLGSISLKMNLKKLQRES